MKHKPSLMLRLCHFVASICARLGRRAVIMDHYYKTKKYLIRHYLIFKDRPDFRFTNAKAKAAEELKIATYGKGHRLEGQTMPLYRRALRRVYRRIMAYLGIFNLSLHNILRSDNDDALHDHPWLFYLTIILTGGYWEHTPKGRFWRGPGSVLFRWGTTRHRLELDPSKGETWTLFTMGPHIREWGFCDMAGMWWIRWFEYLHADPLKSIKRAILRKPHHKTA